MKEKKIKLILIDFNGVAVLGDHKATAKHFGKIYKTPWKKEFDVFYTKYFNLVVTNKISESEGWRRPVKELDWKVDWREIRKWHLEQQRLNPPVISMIRKLRLEGYQVVLLSKNLIGWFRLFEKRLRFRQHFHYAINTQEINLPKASSETMRWVFRRFNVKPRDVLYIDDQEQNLVAPKRLGVHTILYQSFAQCKREVAKAIGTSWNRSFHEWVEVSQRQRMSAFPNVFSTQAMSTVTSRLAGHFFNLMMILENRLMWFMADKEDYFNATQNLVRKVLDDPKFIPFLTAQVRKYGNDLIAFARSVSRSKLRLQAGATLAKYYRTYQQKYIRMYGHYFPALQVDVQLSQYLRSLLFQKVKTNNEVEKYFNTLTTNTSAMYPKEEELGLYSLARTVARSKALSREFRRPFNDLLVRITKYPHFNKKFLAHCRAYFWITRDYEDPVWRTEDFLRRLQGIVSKGNIDAQYARISFFHKNIKQKISLIENRLHLTQEERQAFVAMRNGVYLKEFRKRFVSLSLYYMDPLIHEYSRRLGIAVPHVRQFLADEPYQALVKGKNFEHILRERYLLSAYITRKGKVAVVTGKRAEKIKKNVLSIPTTWKTLTGVPVSGGKVRGPAKVVINLDELPKVRPGDIIVTIQAVPSFSTAIQKSAGMTADGGTGITSHPATLAREAGIPCVTGLRIASQVIKDGDIIEVDGNLGVVRKIRSR